MLILAHDTFTIPPSLALVNLLLTCLAVGGVIVYVMLLKGQPQNRLTVAIDKLGLNTIHPVFAIAASVFWLLLFASLVAGLFYVIEGVIARSFPADQTETIDLRWSLLALTAFTATLGAVVTLPLSLIRTRQNARQTEVAEQGLITDRINKAVEGLGAEKTVKRAGGDQTEPNLEVRIGALFALERISQDSARDHIQIMEILCAYIRNNADRHSPAVPKEEPEEGWRVWGEVNRTHPPLDVDIALRIIERRSDERKQREEDANYRLGLQHAPLHALVLQNWDLSGADLSYAGLQGSSFEFGILTNTKWYFAKADGADLCNVQLQNADLSFSSLNDTDCYGIDLSHSTLFVTHLVNASLVGANFFGIKTLGSTINSPMFRSSDLSKSSFRSVDLRLWGIDQRALGQIFADGSAILPDGLERESPNYPTHWPEEILDNTEYDERWRAWQAEIGFQPDENP